MRSINNLSIHNPHNTGLYRHTPRYIALQQKRRREKAMGLIISLLMFVIAGYAMARLATRAIYTHISNQDTMLCESAKISGNAEYTQKCQCYYKGADISCIQKGGDF